MEKKKLLALVSLILILIAVFFYSRKESKTQSLLEARTYKLNKDNATSNSAATISFSDLSKETPLHETLRRIQTLCTNSKPLTTRNKNLNFKSNQLARNLHFNKSGEIFRLRVFLEDSQESSYEKLIYYKEDTDGFARVLKIPEKDQRSPTQETIRKYLGDGEIIYDERDIRLQSGDVNIDYTTINGRIVKIVSPDLNCQYDNF